MTSDWEPTTVDSLRPGDRVRLASGAEFDIARIDSPFLGMDQMVCLIEDTPDRWHAYPAGKAAAVDVQRHNR